MVPDSWDFDKLLALALGVESAIANLSQPGQLVDVYQAATLGADPYTRRAWADVAPAAGLRKFGDCKQVNELASLALATLGDLESEAIT